VTQIKFEGNPCIKCGSATRYIGSGKCVACRCAALRARYAANPEKAREYKRARREANPEKVREINRARRAAYPEKEREAKRARHAAHPEKDREYRRARREANPEKARAAGREAKRARYAANPEKTIEKSRARRALENGAASDGTHRLWGERLREHDGTCVHCGERASKLTLDHFVPLSKGGAHVLLNFVPSCRSCNLAKGATVIAMTARIRSFIDGSLATCTRNQGGVA
jgi:5-methylcytosine-specific restriction endonuclease McrA